MSANPLALLDSIVPIGGWSSHRDYVARRTAAFVASDLPRQCVLRSDLYACDVKRLAEALGDVDLARNPALAVALVKRDAQAIGDLLLQAIDYEIADDAQQDVEDEDEVRRERVL